MVPDVDSSRPHMARIYDYFLGGKNHFAADRETAEKILQTNPAIRIAARENRAFLGRSVRYLAAEAGIRQFLDIGTGLPTTDNVHEVAQAVAPASRVVYVDNDPLVLAHARALLNSAPAGRTAYIHADLREPRKILDDPATPRGARPQPADRAGHAGHPAPHPGRRQARGDHRRPARRAAERQLLRRLAHHDGARRRRDRGRAARLRGAGLSAQARNSDEFARLAFAGLELVPPGVVLVSEWRPGATAPRPAPAEVNCYGGVARKP